MKRHKSEGKMSSPDHGGCGCKLVVSGTVDQEFRSHPTPLSELQQGLSPNDTHLPKERTRNVLGTLELGRSEVIDDPDFALTEAVAFQTKRGFRDLS